MINGDIETLELNPGTLDAFVYQREGQFRIKTLQQRIENYEGSEQKKLMSQAELSYQGRVITREVEEPYTNKTQGSRGVNRDESSGMGKPNIYAFLVDLLQGVRELEAITNSHEKWNDLFGSMKEDGQADSIYEERQQAVRDAQVLLGEDYGEFAAVSDYDENFLWLAGIAALIVPQGDGKGSEEIVVTQWLRNKGDVCDKGNPIAVVEVEGKSVEIVADTQGTLFCIVVAEGETIHVRSAIGYIALNDD